jgi:hypothetical protein
LSRLRVHPYPFQELFPTEINPFLPEELLLFFVGPGFLFFIQISIFATTTPFQPGKRHSHSSNASSAKEPVTKPMCQPMAIPAATPYVYSSVGGEM